MIIKEYSINGKKSRTRDTDKEWKYYKANNETGQTQEEYEQDILRYFQNGSKKFEIIEQ